MSPIRHSTLCKSMKIDVKECDRNCSCNGCNLLKNCKLMSLDVSGCQRMQCWSKPIRNAEVIRRRESKLVQPRASPHLSVLSVPISLFGLLYSSLLASRNSRFLNACTSSSIGLSEGITELPVGWQRSASKSLLCALVRCACIGFTLTEVDHSLLRCQRCRC